MSHITEMTLFFDEKGLGRCAFPVLKLHNVYSKFTYSNKISNTSLLLNKLLHL